MGLNDIENAVSELSPEDYEIFRAWFEGHDAERLGKSGGLAELERRWEAADGAALVPHDEVARWLKSWGSPAFRQFREF